jgi:hypothetical protein
LLLPGLIVAGCVSLTKPESVTRNCPTSSDPHCSDDQSKQLPPAGDDAKKDTVDNPSPDVPSGPETPIIKPDAGPDVPAPVPDSSPDKADSGIGNKDTTDVRNPTEFDDVSPPPADVPIDTTTGAESGPEPPAAEPGPEPQNGPEPGPEPQNGPEPGPEPPRDGGTDTTPASNCTIFFGSAPSTSSAGHPPATNSTAAFCVATCDDIAGWGCSNDTGRTYTVNGTTVACGATISKKNGYYVFQVSAGSNASAVVYWWVSGAWATSCPAPDGGVFP